MSLKTSIKDGAGTERELCITEYNAAKTHTVVAPLAPQGTNNRMEPFTVKVDIHNGGTNGSVTPVEFVLLSSDSTGTFDYYITSIDIVISDGTQSASKFGAITSLPNGVDLYTQISGSVNYLASGASTGGELCLWAGVIFSNQVITGWATNDDALVATFDLAKQIPGAGGLTGVRIGRGKLDKVVYVVNDNLTTLSDSFAYIRGFKLYE